MASRKRKRDDMGVRPMEIDFPVRKKRCYVKKELKHEVWDRCIGLNIQFYPCLRCKSQDMSQMDFQCLLVLSPRSGGESQIDNLIPVCPRCNTYIKKKRKEQE
jgi:hypothetical protein